MNAKYMAVFAVAIMLVGCAVVLTNADAADVSAADETAEKTVYVKVGGTATLNIETTESALGGDYFNTVTWVMGSTDIVTNKGPIYDTNSTGTEIATVEVDGADGSYYLTFTGENAGTNENVSITYSVETNVQGQDVDDSNDLVQKIQYTIKLYVIPASFNADINKTTFNNRESVGNDGVEVTYSGITLGSDGDYYIYALGLPKGLALNTDGKIYGTPDVDDRDFGDNLTKTYDVTFVATHKASNISISKTVDITLQRNSDDFTYEVTTGGIMVSDGVYKIVRGQEFSVTTMIGEDSTNVTEVYLSSDNTGEKKVVTGSDGVYDVGDGNAINGTGSYTVVMINGTEELSFQLIVIEPLSDVVADIGYLPGFTYNSTL